MTVVSTIVFSNFDFNVFVCGAGEPDGGCNQQIVVADVVLSQNAVCEYFLTFIFPVFTCGKKKFVCVFPIKKNSTMSFL